MTLKTAKTSRMADDEDTSVQSARRPASKRTAEPKTAAMPLRGPTRPETPLVPTRESFLYECMKAGVKPALQHMYVERTIITPEIAKWLLEINHERNRNLSKDRAGKMGRIVAENEWRVMGDTIVLSDHGALINGQHRAAGIDIGGKPVETLVVYGILDEQLAWIDHLRARSMGDMLRVEGLLKSDKGSGPITVLHWLEHQDFSLRDEWFQLRETLILHKKGLEWAAEHVPSKIDNPPTKAGRKEIYAGFAYLYPTAKTKMPTLLQKYESGEGLTKTHPMMQLRNLVGPEGLLAKTGEVEKSRIAMVLRCLEAGLKETPLTSANITRLSTSKVNYEIERGGPDERDEVIARCHELVLAQRKKDEKDQQKKEENG